MSLDREKLLKPLPKNMKRALLATASVVVASHAIAFAQEQDTGPQAPLRFRNDYFGYGLAVGPRVSYTDNISLSSGPTPLQPFSVRDDELAFSIASNGSAIYSNNRITGIIDGSLDVSYLTDQAEVVASQDVGAAGTVTLADNFLYFDVAGSTSRQLAGENARFSQNVNAGRSQRVNVHNFALSPYVNHRFPNGSAAELRYRFSQVFIDNNRVNQFGSTIDGNTRTQEVVASYNTGNAIDRIQVGLTAYGNKTRDYGSSVLQDYEYKQGTLEGDAQVELTERFAVTGAIGYDDVNTTAPATFIPEDQLTGLYWRAGFRAKPGRKTDVRLEYGRRYDDDFINARVRYDLSERVTFAASAGRSFQTRAQAVSTQFEALQRRTLDFVQDLRDGNIGDAADVIDALTRSTRTRVTAQQIGLGISNDANAQLSGDFGRTVVNAYGNYQDTDYGFRSIKTFGGGLSAERELSRRMTGYLGVFYRHVDSTSDLTICQANPELFGFDITIPGFDPIAACASLVSFEGKTNTVGGRIGVAYRLYQNVSAFGEYAHTERFSQNVELEYGENTATVGVQVEF